MVNLKMKKVNQKINKCQLMYCRGLQWGDEGKGKIVDVLNSRL